jgi:peptidoglycan hydrolase-like protein with peptidoglycan-binding domain
MARRTHRLRAGALAGVLALTLTVAAIAAAAAPRGSGGTGSDGGHRDAIASGPLGRQGMWIWILSRSNGGSVASIAKQAHAHGIGTVFIKSSDGRDAWSQFTPGLVDALHARGLDVCAWQYVYGTHPQGEAYQGVQAMKDGADCVVIDAESQYEGRYHAASTYMHRLRAGVGADYPIALASFPYIDYHPGLPYSVFLGPGGAQRNVPQVYWHAIGTSPGGALAHTFTFNRVYKRPIEPLGQTYGDPPLSEVSAFRHLSASYGFDGLSWWSWQSTKPSEWQLLGRANHGVSGFRRTNAYPSLHRASDGDLVVWAQEHLVGAGEKLRVDGGYGGKTKVAVEDFQSRLGLPVTGTIGPLTWKALLKVKPAMVNWAHPRRTLAKSELPRGGEPRSAALPAVRDEIPARPPAG